MISVNGYPLLDMQQDWSKSCTYGLTGKSGRADNLRGEEDRVMYSSVSRRTYSYSVLARGLAQRMNCSAVLEAALAEKKAAVPIWCRARHDFTADGFEYTFEKQYPEIGGYWVLASYAGELTVLQAVSFSSSETAVFDVAAGSDGLHGGELVPLLFGYIKPPTSKMLGGDCESYSIDFIQAQFTED